MLPDIELRAFTTPDYDPRARTDRTVNDLLNAIRDLLYTASEDGGSERLTDRFADMATAHIDLGNLVALLRERTRSAA